MSILIGVVGVVAGSASVIDSLTWAADISAARPADYTDDGGGVISRFGPFSQTTESAKALLDPDGLSAGVPAIVAASGDELVSTDRLISWGIDDFTFYLVMRSNPAANGQQFQGNPVAVSINSVSDVRYSYRNTSEVLAAASVGGGAVTQPVVAVVRYRASDGETHGWTHETAKRLLTTTLLKNDYASNLDLFNGLPGAISRLLLAAELHDDTTVGGVLAQLKTDWSIA